MATDPFPVDKNLTPTITRQRIAWFCWKIALPLAVLALLFFLDFPLRAVVRNQESPFLNHFFDIIKYAGNVIVGFALSLILLIVGKFASKPRLLRVGKLMLLTLILSNLVVIIAKPALNIHPRSVFESQGSKKPDSMRWGRFPSGDTTVAFSVAAALVAEFPQLLIPCYTLGVLVGVERVYFNLHFPSDVFAGAWLGITVVSLLRKKYFL